MKLDVSEKALEGYRLERVALEEPGFLTVYEGSAASGGGEVSVRTFPVPGERRARRAFRRAAKARVAQAHPGLVPAREALERDERLYLVTTASSASTLATRLARRGPLEPGLALGLLEQVARALDGVEWLNDAILSSTQILLEGGPDGERGVLLDPSKTVSLREAGWPWVHPHPHYAPPELGWGEHLGGRSVAYSLGCILFESVTGSRPFEGDWLELTEAHSAGPVPRASERRPELGTALDAALSRALAKDPGERFGSAGELMRAATAALAAGGESPPSRRRTAPAAPAVLVQPPPEEERHPDAGPDSRLEPPAAEPPPGPVPGPSLAGETFAGELHPDARSPAEDTAPADEPARPDETARGMTEEPVLEPHPDAPGLPADQARAQGWQAVEPPRIREPGRAAARALPAEPHPDDERDEDARPAAEREQPVKPERRPEPAAAKPARRPELKPKPAAAKPERRPEPKPEPAAAKPERRPEPPKQERQPAPRPQRAPGPRPKPDVAKPKRASRAERRRAPEAKPKPAAAESKPTPDPQPKPAVAEPKRVPAPESKPAAAEAKPTPRPQPKPAAAKPKRVPDPEPKPAAAESKPTPDPQAKPAAADSKRASRAERKRASRTERRRASNPKSKPAAAEPPRTSRPEPKPAAAKQKPPEPRPAPARPKRAAGHRRAAEPPSRANERSADGVPRRGDERRRQVVSACALAAALAIAGYLIGSAGEPSPDPAKAAANDRLSLKLPADWERRPTSGALPGVALREAVAGGPKGSGTGVVAGRTARTGRDFLPAGLIAPRGHTAEPVRLGRYDAYRHRGLRTADSPRQITAYSIPTAGGAAVLACRGGSRGPSGFMPECERVASTLDLRGLRTISLSAMVVERRRLAATVARLRRSRAAGRRRLADANSPRTQTRAARRLRASYGAARRYLAKLDGATEPPGWQPRVLAAVVSVERAYGRLARAARRRSRPAYQRARRRVSRAETVLARLVAGAASSR